MDPLHGKGYMFQNSTCRYCHTYCGTLYSKRMHLRKCNALQNTTPNVITPNKKCRLCNAKYFLYSTLIDHYKNKHKSSNQFRIYKRGIRNKLAHLQCKLCKKKFFQEHQLYQHSTSKHPESSQTMTLNDKLNPNLPTTYNCVLCDHKFNSSSNLSKHIDFAHAKFIISQDKFQCTGCSKTFLLPTQLLQHIEDKPIGIKHNLNMYKQHISNMKNINQCDKCETLFYTIENYISHIKTVHQSENIAMHIAKAYKHVTGY